MEQTDLKTKFLKHCQNLSYKELHKKLFYARCEKWDAVSIRSDDETYYLYCIFDGGGYRCVIVKNDFNIPSPNFSFKKFGWHPKYFKNEVFGIGEIVNIYFDILKINKLMIFR